MAETATTDPAIGGDQTASVATFTDVGFAYPTGTVALEGLTLAIPDTGVTGIVGPSGCGKSTLLQLLAGLATPTAGRLDVTFAEPTDSRHDVAMVFQQDTVLPWLTVAENVGLYYRFHRRKGQSRNWREDEARRLLATVGLEGAAGEYPNRLSGGMRRRVAFLAAVAPNPQLLLLDEAFSAVDEPTRIMIHQEVLRIVKQMDMTTVLITHDLAEAISLSDRVVILSARPGRVRSIYDIPFGADRDVLTLRREPEFLSLYGRLWDELSTQIERSHAQHDDV
jgi:NitT/TauT family transport system ATP-binding protein